MLTEWSRKEKEGAENCPWRPRTLKVRGDRNTSSVCGKWVVSEKGFGNPNTSCVPKRWPCMSVKALVFLSWVHILPPSSFPSPVVNSYIQDLFCMLSPGSLPGIQEVGYCDTFSITIFSSSLLCVIISLWRELRYYFLRLAPSPPPPAWPASTGQHLQWLLYSKSGSSV